MTSVKDLWDLHRASRFPDGLRGSEVSGEDLVLLDADIAGCVQTFLANGGSLDDERRTILEECCRAVSRVEAGLTGQQREYFARLGQIAQETLRSLESGAADA